MEWSVVYEKAIRDDGSLYFPERLTQEFLDQARRTMGSFIFANQYLNTIVPESERKFRKEWLRYTTEIPKNVKRFAFIDPAFRQNKHSDFTGIAVVFVDTDKNWYVRLATHYKLTPTQIVNKCFDLCKEFNLDAIGVEGVAYQEALIYLISEEMQRRDHFIPLKGIMRLKASKEVRIMGLVPRFEYGSLLLWPGMMDFEQEYHTFPRGTHDDILDALASIEEIVYYPEKEINKLEQPHSPHDPNYEKWIIQQYSERANQDSGGSGSFGEADHF